MKRSCRPKILLFANSIIRKSESRVLREIKLSIIMWTKRWIPGGGVTSEFQFELLTLIGVVWVIRPRGLVLLDISPYTQISRYNTVTWYVNGCNTCLPMVCNKNYATIKSEVRFLELCLVSKLDLNLGISLVLGLVLKLDIALKTGPQTL